MKKYIASIVVLAILTGLTGCGNEKTVSTREVSKLLEPVGVQMDVAKVEYGDVYKIDTYNGMMVPYVEELQFVVDGIFGESYVQVGEKVTEGQVLAALSEENILERLEQLDEEIADIKTLGEFSDRQMTADIEIGKIELEALTEGGASSQTCRLKEVDVQKLEKRLEQARELRQLELQEKQRERKNLIDNLGNNQIIAPFDGTVVYIRDVEEGDGIQGYTTVVCLADENRLYLETEFLSESKITGADKVYAKIGKKEYALEYHPYDMSEYITKVLNDEEIKTQFTVQAEGGKLKSGQFAVVVIMDTCKENVLTIPVNALYRDAGGRYVYKLIDGKRTRCDVTIGVLSNTKAEILEGLAEGDMVYVKD